MNTIDQQIALARHMGFRFEWHADGTLLVVNPAGQVIQKYEPHRRTKDEILSDCIYCLPDYLGDLNAVAAVERTFKTTHHQNSYQAEIASICWGDEERKDNQVVFNQLTASASQRAEALLKTLGLWTE